jgi:antitoxin MazE
MAADLGLTDKSNVDLRTQGGRLEVIPVLDKPLRLEDLLAGITPENLHGEVDTGPSVGHEAW